MSIAGELRQDHSQDYSEWVAAYDTLQEEDRRAIRDGIRRLPRFPTFSFILLPAFGGAASASPMTIASVCRQLYPHWELWLPTDVSTDIGEARLRIIPSGDKSSTNPATLLSAGVAAAEGEFVVPLPSNVTVCESVLYELAVAIGHNPAVDLLYTDEDRIDAEGKRYAPHFKTAWDPDLILGRDSVGLLAAYRRALLARLTSALLSSPTVALTLYDLNLRFGFATSAGRIEHIPAVLCHRLGSTEAPLDRNTEGAGNTEGARGIVRQHLAERGTIARVEPTPLAPGWNRIIRGVPDPAPLVSVIVPTRDRADLLERCADALLNRTDYPAIELFIVDNESSERRTSDLLWRLSGHPKVHILSYDGPFNYSAMNNLAAYQARGEILLLLNNDIDAIEAHWLREMVSHALRPDVGAVGAKLLYANEQVQHAGIVLGPGLALSHQFRFADRLDTGPYGELALARTVMAVTGACLALRRSVFFDVGGLDENLAVAFNDIDLCMRISDHGYRNVWTPFAELFHLEGASRGYDTTPDKQSLAAKEFRYFCRFWGSLLEADPYQNPNIACGWDTVTLSAPPRRRRPWLT